MTDSKFHAVVYWHNVDGRWIALARFLTFTDARGFVGTFDGDADRYQIRRVA